MMTNDEYGYTKAAQAYDYPLTIKQLLHRAKMVSGKQTIHYADRFCMTYDTFFARINRLANVLQGLGLQPGDTVAVMDWDTHRFLECYFAIPMLGLILQTVNVRLSPDKILYTINHARPKVLLLNSEFAPLIKESLIKDHEHEAPSIEQVIWLDDHDTELPDFAVGEYEQLLAQASDVFEFAELDENTIATTFYTSGTTGDPKGVFFTHRQVVLHALAIAITGALNPERIGLRYYSVYMPMTPMFHVNAWGMPYVTTMLGLQQIYPGRYIPSTLVDLIDKYQVSYTHCVPTILQMLLAEKTKRGEKFNNLAMLIGGSALTAGLAKTAIQNGIEVFAGYGMSETCPILTIATSDQPDFPLPYSEAQLEELSVLRTMTGKPAVLVDMQLWDAEGKALPQDGQSVGEVVVRTPWLTPTYTKNPDAGDALWAGGYLHTQDVGYITKDGTLKITDRLKDVIKSGGEWLSSLEIETILSLHPSVADLSVVGISDPKWGERPLALIVKKPDHADTTKEEILALAHQAVERGMIPKYGVPELVFVDAIAKTSVGKNDKKAIRAMVENGTIALT